MLTHGAPVVVLIAASIYFFSINYWVCVTHRRIDFCASPTLALTLASSSSSRLARHVTSLEFDNFLKPI